MSVFTIELLVSLKTADTTALTAKNTIQHDLGYESVLLDLKREECWLIDVDAESADAAEKLGREFATVVKIFVNPNKHTYSLKVVEAGVSDSSASLRGAERGSNLNLTYSPFNKGGESPPYEIGVLVGYREDEKALIALRTLRDTYGYGERVKGILRSTLWKLVINAKSKDSARKIAEEITRTSGMSRGLLANPHSQTYTVL